MLTLHCIQQESITEMKKSEDKILSVIDKYNMVSAGDTVVVAVSGGADSMCLLHFFNKYSIKLKLNIICAHVNHGIRGKEAERDEEFVRKFCEKNGIKSVFAHFNVPEIAKENGESEEQCGRRLRYEFFSSISENAKIATAHNLNDSVETFIFNFTRGTGLKGLTGIPPVRDNIIRPLSECTREEIEQYLREENISFVTDSTNLSDEYSRNKIRHNVVPVLTDINNGFFSVFPGCISALTDAENYMSSVTQKAFDEIIDNDTFAVSKVLNLDKVIQDRLLIRIAEHFGATDVSFRHIGIIRAFLEKGGAVMLPGKVIFSSDGKKICRPGEKLTDCVIEELYDADETTYHFPGGTLIVEKVDKDELKDYNVKQLSSRGYADAEKLEGSVFRSRKEGDRFRFPFAEHSKSLKNLFKEKGIFAAARWGVPMLADDRNILWINGVGVSEYAAINDETKKVVKIKKM